MILTKGKQEQVVMCKSLQEGLLTYVNGIGERIDPVYSHNLGLFKCVMLDTHALMKDVFTHFYDLA